MRVQWSERGCAGGVGGRCSKFWGRQQCVGCCGKRCQLLVGPLLLQFSAATKLLAAEQRVGVLAAQFCGCCWVVMSPRCRPASPCCLPACLLQTNKRMVPYLFVRGDGVILVSPPLRS